MQAKAKAAAVGFKVYELLERKPEIADKPGVT